MEPVVELAVRVASLLAFVRDYFPDARSLEDAVKSWGSRIEQAAAEDYAVLRTLQEFVEPEENCEPPKGFRQLLWLPKEPGESDPLTRTVKKYQIPLTHTEEQKRAALAGLFAGKLQSCLQRLQTALPGVLLFKELRPAPHGASTVLSPLHWVGFTREEIGERAANAMLANPASVPEAAKALNYTPQLIKELTKLSHIPSEKFLAKKRKALRRYCRFQKTTVPFSFALSDELEEIRRLRPERLRGLTWTKINLPPERDQLPREQAYQDCLFGLALSGGGIRSATFALGVLQAMADRNLLPFVDYLSTVSGGGYIGSWLVAWTKRRGSICAVQESLRGSATSLQSSSGTKAKSQPDVEQNSDPRAEHVRPVRMLREYARYLAPQAGLLSADSWTILTTWLRNTALFQMVLIFLFSALVLLPRSAAYLALGAPHWYGLRSLPRGQALPVFLAGAPWCVACAIIGLFNLRAFRFWRNPSDPRSGRGDDELTVIGSVLLLVIIGAFSVTIALWGFRAYEHPAWAALWAGIVFFGGMLILGYLSTVRTSDERIDVGQHTLTQATFCGWALISALAGGLLIYALCKLFLQELAENTQRGTWLAVTAGPCLLLLIISIVVIVLIGLLGNTLSDEQREWWSRLGAWVGIVVAAWLVVSLLCFFSPLWIAKAALAATAAGVSWVAISWQGVRLAFSARSGKNGDDNDQGPLSNMVMAAAPAVFVLGFLATISFALYYALNRALEWNGLAQYAIKDPVAHQLSSTGASFAWQKLANHYWDLMYPDSLLFLIAAVLFSILAVVLDRRIDINEFSMHHFYKNRLVRAYLGASRPRERRWPNAFTDFDMEDDVRLARFHSRDITRQEDTWTNCKRGYIGPYPIINTALNVTHGSLAHQERRAESFIFTPLWSGFDFTRKQTAVPSVARSEYAFRRTDEFAFPKHGIFLGTAMAISGAAASSNAGFHTSPSLAFLLTVFNVRLGWWIGNPAGKKWQNSSPQFGLGCLLNELAAQTTTESDYLLLSDGGHFENMGLYELIRRRCRYIVISDAEEDAKFKLEGIGGAIRKCRVDFGVVIDLDLKALQPIGDPAESKLHYSIGTILYPEHLPTRAGQKDKSQENPCGILVYIKSSMTGDEPVDVAEFRKRQPHFPHDSTTNQFFDESHFESYRTLGHHAAQAVFNQDAKAVLEDENGNLAEALRVIFHGVETTYQKRISGTQRRKAQA
jgi:hypothetical protein